MKPMLRKVLGATIVFVWWAWVAFAAGAVVTDLHLRAAGSFFLGALAGAFALWVIQGGAAITFTSPAAGSPAPPAPR